MASKPAITDSFPDWARRLTEKYDSQTTALFVITGNVHDLVPIERNGRLEFVPLSVFLNEALFGRRDLVLTYDRGAGLAFANPDMQADFARALQDTIRFTALTYSKGLPRNPDGVLSCWTAISACACRTTHNRADGGFRGNHRARRRHVPA